MKMQPEVFWYNFKTDAYEPHTEAPADLRDYLPQVPAAQSLYGLYVDDLDKSPLEAAKEVLLACVKNRD